MQEKKPQKGRVLMGLGLLLLAVAFVLALRLIKEERDADASSQRVLSQMMVTSEPEPAATAAPEAPAPTPLFTPQPMPGATDLPGILPVMNNAPAVTAAPEAAATPVPSASPALQAPVRALFEINPDMEMPITVIESNEYIGILDLPVLGISLPVMSDWSYPQLKIAPCRYKGSAYTGDLIISAHNYERHFGRLTSMIPGDEVRFTDVDGNVFYYAVCGKEKLDMRNVQGMMEGEWDMTLFTCVPGGARRETLRCRLVRYEIAAEAAQ